MIWIIFSGIAYLLGCFCVLLLLNGFEEPEGADDQLSIWDVRLWGLCLFWPICVLSTILYLSIRGYINNPKPKKRDSYFISSHRFLGSDTTGYNYEITFNKSLEHTGKFSAIQEALDNYNKSKWQKLWIAIKNIFI
jgi:hypothetical protein